MTTKENTITMRLDRRAAGLALIAVLLVAPATQATALVESDDDPQLDQTIDPDQEVATDEIVLDVGHVDMGPRFVDDAWTLLVHDDTRIEGSLWRPLESTVIRVSDAAQLAVPDDEDYAFLGVDAGEEVHVVPQTQNTDVVWLGWNTQDPQVIDRLDRGMTLTLEQVAGPGNLIVYLQDGGFGPPQTLWDSRQPERQDLWVDVNTHTHANWVFTEPGVYLVELTAAADLVDGSSVADTRFLRFSVGDDVDPAEAFAADPEPRAAAATAGAEDPATPTSERDGPAWLLWVAVVGAVAVALLAGVVVAQVRSRRIKRAAGDESENRVGSGPASGIGDAQEDR